MQRSRQVLGRPVVEAAALARHGNGKQVRSDAVSVRLDLDAAARQPPAAVVDVDAQRPRRTHDSVDVVAEGDDERGGDGTQRPDPSAPTREGHAHVGTLEAVRLAPPPRRRHAPRPPVLLGVGDGAIEVDLVAAHSRDPRDLRAQQPWMPVLAQAGDHVGGPERAEGPPRPQQGVGEGDVEASVVAQRDAQGALVGHHRGAGPQRQPARRGARVRQRG
jgi:hypothetical protein